MYKFFINDKPLLLTSSAEIPTRFQHLEQIQYQSHLNLMDLVRKAEEPNHNGIALICEDPAGVFQILKSNFTSIHAGGGIVFNEDGKLLLMKRLGKWDLPKGKIDPGETAEEGALREVEEECGLNQLSIDHFFDNSYHTYKIKGHRFLKVTHWYVMNTIFNGELVPQLEENITEVKWEDFSSIQLSDFDTYKSIREILFQLREKQS